MNGTSGTHNEIYFDHAATTRPCEQALAAMDEANRACFGNPSSAHAAGQRARRLVDGAARTVGDMLGVPAETVVFTSGGTEANSLAILGVCGATAGRAGRGAALSVVTNLAEHPSVTACAEKLLERGFRVTNLPLREDGLVDLHALEEAVTGDDAFVSLMHVNNETGVIQDVEAAGQMIKRVNKNAVFHVDGVQGLGKHPLDLRHVDLYTVSAHKIHGPKGVGACVVQKRVKASPLFYGGGQMGGLRPGTENTAGIAGFAAALRTSFENTGANLAHVKMLKHAFIGGLGAVGGATVNGREGEGCSPYVANVSFAGVKAEVLRNALSERGIYVSTGAACRQHGKESNVLIHYGLPRARAESALRFSFSRENTAGEVARCLAALAELTAYLRKFNKGNTD